MAKRACGAKWQKAKNGSKPITSVNIEWEIHMNKAKCLLVCPPVIAFPYSYPY